MYPYVSRMLLVCIRMYPYVPYVTSMLLVCYSYVTRMYSCCVLVMIVQNHTGNISVKVISDDCIHVTGLSIKRELNVLLPVIT